MDSQQNTGLLAANCPIAMPHVCKTCPQLDSQGRVGRGLGGVGRAMAGCHVPALSQNRQYITSGRHNSREVRPASSFLHSVKRSLRFLSSLYLLIMKLRYSLYTCKQTRGKLFAAPGIVKAVKSQLLTQKLTTCTMQEWMLHKGEITFGVLDCALPLKKSGTDLRSMSWISL